MRYLASAIIAASLLGMSSLSLASQNPMLGQLAELGGAAEAANELCETGFDIASAKQQQLAQFQQMGGTPAQFEAGYKAGYDRTKAEYGAASSSERSAMCNEFRGAGQAGR